MAAVRPIVDAWIVEALIYELSAVDRHFRPYFSVSVISSLIPRGLIEGLKPLKHFDPSSQTIRVLGDDPEVVILKIFLVLCSA